ncbi:MAG: glycerol dehydrogenase, partial [Oscillospiraceae bacterium]|nr:glycerol dehydrogenase [Oscillospiraceae bacterium]
TGLAQTKEGRDRSFAEVGITQTELVFSGESSEDAIAAVSAAAKDAKADVLIACGGGKAIDTVKAAAVAIALPFAVVPTVASNDAPCSSVSVVYREDGSFDRLLFLGRNPDLVLVDTKIIANAPVRMLVAGMGDALATYYEAVAGKATGAVNVPGGQIPETAITLARLCRDTLLEFGIGAILAARKNVVTPALERVVEANTLLSGVGFESGSVALAHALSEGLTTVPAAHKYLHGELVAFGLLAQLIHENTPHAEFSAAYGFCKSVGLPTTLAEIGITTDEELMSACKIAAEPGRPSHNLLSPVTAESVFAACVSVDAISEL